MELVLVISGTTAGGGNAWTEYLHNKRNWITKHVYEKDIKTFEKNIYVKQTINIIPDATYKICLIH